MSDTDIRNREHHARRDAHQQGLKLVKARTRNERAVQYRTYMLADLRTSAVVAMGLPGGWGLSLDEVERELAGD